MLVYNLPHLKTHVATPRMMNLHHFRLGLNTAEPPNKIDTAELSQAVNLHVLPGGRLKVRPAITQYSNTAAPSGIITTANLKIDEKYYTLIQTDDFKLYYLDTNKDPVLIGDLAARAEIVPYNDVAIIMDGAELKYVDKALDLKLAFDAGTGGGNDKNMEGGFQYNAAALVDDGTAISLNGTNTRVAYKFTSGSWAAGMRIPPMAFTVKLSKTGTLPDTNDVMARIRSVADDSILAEAPLIKAEKVPDTPTDIGEFYATGFWIGDPADPDDDVPPDYSKGMLPDTEYYACVEWDAGTSSNHIDVHCSKSGNADHTWKYASAWTAEAASSMLSSMGPGLAPHAKFGDVFNARLFVVNDDEPGRTQFSNLTHLDWSTPNQAGWIGAIDNSKNSYPIGAIRTLYAELYVYGTAEFPYISRLRGSIPTEYMLDMLFHRVYTTQRTLMSVVSDLWSASKTGVDNLTGVQAHGDLRATDVGVAVSNRIKSYFDPADSFSGFHSKDGHYWLVMPPYHRVLVGRIFPTSPSIQAPIQRYPWQEYEFYRDDFLRDERYKWFQSTTEFEYYLAKPDGSNPGITRPEALTINDRLSHNNPVGSLHRDLWGWGDDDLLGFDTVYLFCDQGNPGDIMEDIRSVFLVSAISSGGEPFLLGNADGFLYALDESARDLDMAHTNPYWRSAYIEFSFGETNLDGIQLIYGARAGVDTDIAIYTDDYEFETFFDYNKKLAISDDLRLGEATMMLKDLYVPLGSRGAPPWRQLNINARSIMIRGFRHRVVAYPNFIDGVILRHRILQH